MSKATPESVQAVFSPDSLHDEIAHLNSLLTDSYATTSALFQLLRDHDIPVGSPELIKAREKVEVEVEMQTLRTANAGLVEKVSETQAALDLSARQLLETVNDRNSIGVQLDLLRDELVRIRARIGETGLIGEHPELSSIAGYCERAQNDIAVRYTPIQERDRLEREVLKLAESVADRERERDHANDTASAVLSENAMLTAKLQVLEAARTQAAANSLANMLSHEELEAKVKRLVEALDTLEVRGDQMNDELYPPDSNCSCHISPPCNDCVDWSSMRMAKRDWEEAKQKAAKAKGQP